MARVAPHAAIRVLNPTHEAFQEGTFQSVRFQRVIVRLVEGVEADIIRVVLQELGDRID